MELRKRTRDAVEILHRRYIKDDPERKAALEAARVNAQVARTIYELRTQAELSQKQLADLIGTTQSVISRLEDEEYEGHSLNMLNRIAKALNQRLTVVMKASDPKVDTMRYAFQTVLRDLRRLRGLTIDQLAKSSGVDREELLAAERDPGYRPPPLTLHQISRFYKISERRLAVLAGAFTQVPDDLAASASRFAAQSESFSTLTEYEKKALDEFVQLLKYSGE
jgi:transcriptional regulator with XRE-family HTH domain